MLIAQDSCASGAVRETRAIQYRVFDPPRGKAAQNVPMCDNHHIGSTVLVFRFLMNASDLGDQIVDARCNGLLVVAIRTSVSENIPLGLCPKVDFMRRQALIVTIIPFSYPLRLLDRYVARQAKQLKRPLGSLSWTDVYFFDVAGSYQCVISDDSPRGDADSCFSVVR